MINAINIVLSYIPASIFAIVLVLIIRLIKRYMINLSGNKNITLNQ